MNAAATALLGARVFDGLSAEARAQAIARARVRRLRRGELLERQGEPARRFYIVESGTLKLTQVTAGGRAIIVRFVVAGQPFGAMAALERGVYPVTAQAVEPTAVLEWSRETLSRLIAEHPRIRANLMAVIADHLTEALSRVTGLATERVAQRVARTLLRLARQTGRAVERGVLIPIPLTRQDLAELADTTLYSVSRTLARWTAAGVLESRGRRLVLRAPERLAEIAGAARDGAAPPGRRGG